MVFVLAVSFLVVCLFVVSGSCVLFVVVGYWFLVFGFWFVVVGSWLLVFGFWFQVGGSWFVVFGLWFLGFVFCVRFPVSGFWLLVLFFGFCSLRVGL